MNLDENELMSALDASGAPSGLTVHDRILSWEKREAKYKKALHSLLDLLQAFDVDVIVGGRDPFRNYEPENE